jgi:aryl-alcohol dehydrogenase-like predicted oxidoreductase
MKYRQLGNSDLNVSEISLGSWLTYAGGLEEDKIKDCTEKAFEVGINFFDTANIYGRGAAEEAWGKILSQHPRDSYILATKVWGQMSDDPEDKGLSAKQIAKQIDASLERLQTDYVDLYQAHRFDIEVPIEETIEALGKVVSDGKPRYIGFSEWTKIQIEAALQIAPHLFVSSQPQYSMLWQAPEAELFNISRDNHISNIVWSPLAQGILTGKYKPGQQHPKDSRAAHSEMGKFMNIIMSEESLEAVQRLEPIARDINISLTEMALAWVLRRDEVASAIIGASRPEQVEQNAKASGIELSQDTIKAIDEALGGVPVKGDTIANRATEGVKHRS